MDLSAEQRVVPAISILGFVLLLLIAHLIRSIVRSAPVGPLMARVHIGLSVSAIIGSLGVAGYIDGACLTGLLGSVVGYSLGSRYGERREE